MPQTERATGIPEKLYYRIGEVSRIAKLEAHVLRFWEKEFPMLRPVKSDTGHRMYRRKDLDIILEIKKLLYQEGFTIDGARKKLRQDLRQQKLVFPSDEQAKVKKIREEVRDLLAVVSRPLRKG